jgi:hypothetical protein
MANESLERKLDVAIALFEERTKDVPRSITELSKLVAVIETKLNGLPCQEHMRRLGDIEERVMENEKSSATLAPKVALVWGLILSLLTSGMTLGLARAFGEPKHQTSQPTTKAP